MSSEFVNLLDVISSDLPGGDEHIYSRQLRESFVSLRKPETPNGDNDTGYRRSADWDSIVELSTTALVEQTKDLRIVCHLTEAWTQIRGFDGLADGLQLLADFVETCWDRCNPPLEDGDLEIRTAPLENMLDDPDRGICFPLTVRQIPLLGSSDQSADYLRCQELNQSNEEEDRQQFEKLILTTDPQIFADRIASIERSSQNLDQLKCCMNEKIGDAAPALTYLRAAISDCEQLVRRVRTRIIEIDDEPEADEPGDLPAKADATARVNQESKNQIDLNSRDAAYRQLSAAAEFLQKTEPHSPIPYLVYRAVSLGQLPFPELVQQLVREEGILNELRREFGIKQQQE